MNDAVESRDARASSLDSEVCHYWYTRPLSIYISCKYPTWHSKRQKLSVDVTPIMVSWHYQEPVAFLKTPNHATAIQYYPRRVFIRVSPIIPSWHEMPYNCARSHTGENINERLTYPSIVLVINDLSRSTHTDTRIAAPTDRRRSVIALGGGLDNRALQAKFDSRNRNIPCMQYSK